MIKKYYVFAIASLLLIPVVTVLGAGASIAIDPEIAIHTDNYVRNFRILNQFKTGLLLSTFGLDVGLWVLACFFLLKSKKQSYGWLPLCVLGPIGLILLTILPDNDPFPSDLYQQFLRRMRTGLRVAYELGLLLLVWNGAFLFVFLIGEIRILVESAITGTPGSQIINVQLASSGMWAFSEGLEALGLVVLFYVTFPLLFNIAGRVYGFWAKGGNRDLQPIS